MRARPTARTTPRNRSLSRSDLSAGIRLVFGNPALRTPMLLGWLVAFYDIPEGVVAPLSQSLGGGDLAAGLILAAAASAPPSARWGSAAWWARSNGCAG